MNATGEFSGHGVVRWSSCVPWQHEGSVGTVGSQNKLLRSCDQGHVEIHWCSSGEAQICQRDRLPVEQVIYKQRFCDARFWIHAPPPALSSTDWYCKGGGWWCQKFEMNPSCMSDCRGVMSQSERLAQSDNINLLLIVSSLTESTLWMCTNWHPWWRSTTQRRRELKWWSKLIIRCWAGCSTLVSKWVLFLQRKATAMSRGTWYRRKCVPLWPILCAGFGWRIPQSGCPVWWSWSEEDLHVRWKIHAAVRVSEAYSSDEPNGWAGNRLELRTFLFCLFFLFYCCLVCF